MEFIELDFIFDSTFTELSGAPNLVYTLSGKKIRLRLVVIMAILMNTNKL